MRTNLVAQPFDCQNCLDRMPTRQEVLRLQLLADAGRKAHAKVRQPFIPGAGHAHLLRTILGGKFSNRVQIPDGAFGPKKFRGCVERLPFFDAALYPNFVDTLLLPVGKQADAVGAGFDGVKVVSHFTERSEERRVGKECRSWWLEDNEKKR